MNTRQRTKTQRRIFEGSHQLNTEFLWKSFKEVLNQDIFKGLYTLIYEEDQYDYLRNLEGIFIQKALNYKVPKHIVLKSDAYKCIMQLTRKTDLTPSQFRRTITQCEMCALRKVKHAKLT